MQSIKNPKAKIDDFVKSPISALCAIFEESHVHLSTINSSKIAQALILAFLQSRLKATFYEIIIFDSLVKSHKIKEQMTGEKSSIQ